MSGTTRETGGDEPRESRIPLSGDAPIALTIHNPNGMVTIRPGDDPDVLIRHTKFGLPGSPSYNEARMVIDVHDGHQIEVHPHLSNTGAGGIGWAAAGAVLNALKNANERGHVKIELGPGSVRYDIEVELPRQARIGQVAVRTASGDVEIDGVAASVSLTTASGDVHGRSLTGELTAHTASGDIVLDNVSGRLTARTASGDVQVNGATLAALSLATASGDIGVDGAPDGSGPYHIETVSGDTRLGVLLPDSARGAEITFQSVSGDASVDPPFEKVKKRTWRVGGGGSRIAIRSVSGDLRASATVAAPGAAPPAAPAPTAPFVAPAPQPPAPPTPPAPLTPPDLPLVIPIAPTDPVRAERADDADATPEPDIAPLEGGTTDRLAVLQAVERGEIDIEEALRRLEPAPPPAVEP